MGGRTFRPFGRGSVALFDGADARPDAGCFADEVVIDFPSVAPAVDRMRSAFLADERAAALSAAIRLSRARGAGRRDGAARGAGALHVPRLRRPRRDVDRAVRPMPGQRHASCGIISCRWRYRLASSTAPASTSPSLPAIIRPPASSFASSSRSGSARHASRHPLRAVWGALAALVGVSMLLLAAGALDAVDRARRRDGGACRGPHRGRLRLDWRLLADLGRRAYVGGGAAATPRAVGSHPDARSRRS